MFIIHYSTITKCVNHGKVNKINDLYKIRFIYSTKSIKITTICPT